MPFTDLVNLGIKVHSLTRIKDGSQAAWQNVAQNFENVWPFGCFVSLCFVMKRIENEIETNKIATKRNEVDSVLNVRSFFVCGVEVNESTEQTNDRSEQPKRTKRTNKRNKRMIERTNER